MKFVLEKGFASSLQWKDFNFPVKDRVDSQRLRNQGNQVYQKNKLVEALELYTQSICLAPHPPPSPNTFVFQVYIITFFVPYKRAGTHFSIHPAKR